MTLGESSNDIILWNEVALQAVRDTRSAPTITARTLAIVHTGIYDAWSAYDSRAVSTQLGDTLQRPEAENTFNNKAEATSYAAYRTLVDLFPSQANQFNQVMTSLGYDPSNTSTDTSTPAGIGNVTAQVLLDFRYQDGSNQLGNLNLGAYSDYTNYQPVNSADTLADPNRWQPLPIPNGQGGFTEQRFTTPHWGLVTPFALVESGSQVRPSTGPKTTAEIVEYENQAQQVFDLVANLNDEQKTIAQYWSDGPSTETPPGHWNLFAQDVSARDKHDIDDDVQMFFVLNNALFDTSIAVWDTKRAYDSARPVTAIRYLIDEDWSSYIATPPFPEYVSGHSAFSAAGAEVLKLFTGSDVFGAAYTQLAGTSLIPNQLGPATNITLSWDTFSVAAEEAGISRRYG
ncbi:vanadium-dependent haloperoxidase [Nostoc sp.]|uniref:vanadium-dependent haloperoxidase n=1 Tax=Nostoc sp. TaxID=1180 RepID=UPI0035932FE3